MFATDAGCRGDRTFNVVDFLTVRATGLSSPPRSGTMVAAAHRADGSVTAMDAPRPLAGQESVLLFCSWASPDTAADVWLTSTMIIIQPSSPDPVGNCLAPGGQANPGPWRGSESRPLAGSKRFGCLVCVAKEWTARFHSYPAPQHRSPSIAQSFMPPSVRRQPDSPSAWQSGKQSVGPSAWQSGLSV